MRPSQLGHAPALPAATALDITMQDSDDIKALLVEIRDLQREHLTEYRRVTQQSLELQQRSIGRQEQFAGLYRRVAAAGATLIVVIVIIIVLLMGRLFQ